MKSPNPMLPPRGFFKAFFPVIGLFLAMLMSGALAAFTVSSLEAPPPIIFTAFVIGAFISYWPMERIVVARFSDWLDS